MTSKTFITGTVIDSPWLNDVNDLVYDIQTSTGTTLVGYLPDGTGAVATTLKKELERQTVSVFRFMTDAEVTAVKAYSFTTDVTTACQTALTAAHSAKVDLFFPSGGYSVTGLTIPGSYTGPDARSWSFRIYGQGCGNPFTTSYTGSTVLKSTTDAPILTDNTVPSANSNSSITIDNIKFDGNSTTPVVLLNTMYGVSSFHHNAIYQRGDGDGFKLLYGATCAIHDCYSVNSDFVTVTLGAARTGVGFHFINSYAAGLVSFRNCTARGWHDGYMVDGLNSTEKAYSVRLEHFECSVVYNGVTVGADCTGVVVDDGYFEGMDQGTAITVLCPYAIITNNKIFQGSLVGIDAGGAGLGGVNIHSNLVNIGTKVNGIGISLQSSGNTRNQNCANNTIIYTAGTVGVNGIKIAGTDPRMNVIGNYFEPGTSWTGAGSVKINDTSLSGVRGLLQKELSTGEIVSLSRGEISLLPGPTAFVQADVVGNLLTLPSAGSSFICSATGAASVNKIAAGVTPGRIVIFRTTTANMSFVNSAYIKTAAAATFTGPGQIMFNIDRVGADNYAYEISRTVF